MDKALKSLFDYQKFAENKRLSAFIKETQERCLNVLSDDEPEGVSAAGGFKSEQSFKKTEDK